jgi:hypothetical protein
MGWLFSYEWDSPRAIQESLNRQRRLPIVAQAATLAGKHLWTVYQMPDGRRFISLDLIKHNNGRWGYKDMNEDMGPFYYDCPLKLLDVAGAPPTEDAAKWRAEVLRRKQAAAKRKTFRRGDVD